MTADKNMWVFNVCISLSASVCFGALLSVEIKVEGGNQVPITNPAVFTCSYNKTTDDSVFIVSFLHTDDPLSNPDPITVIGGYVLTETNNPSYYNGFNPPDYTIDIADIDNGDSGSCRLTIASTSIDDNRRYWCYVTSLITAESGAAEVNLTVVVSAKSINMSQDGIEVSLVTVTEGISSNIVCTSFRSAPVLVIVWSLQKEEIADDITSGAFQTTTILEDRTSDSVSTLEYSFSKDYNGGTLTCKTREHHLTESRSDSAIVIVQYAPAVTVTLENNLVLCKSDANPAASIHVIEVSRGKLEYSPLCEDTTCILSFEVDYDTDVRCSATNAVGTGTAALVVVPGLPGQPETVTPTMLFEKSQTDISQQHTRPMSRTELPKHLAGDELTINIAAIILGMLLCISVTIIVILLHQVYRLNRYKNNVPKQDTAQNDASNVPQTYMELDPQTRQCETTYEEPVVKDPVKSDIAQAYEDLNPNTREENTSYEILTSKETEISTYEEIPAAKKSQAYVNTQYGKP